jgi:hypothetical protein
MTRYDASLTADVKSKHCYADRAFPRSPSMVARHVVRSPGDVHECQSWPDAVGAVNPRVERITDIM